MSKNIITNAQILQRKGRAGRTRAGICYHLYTLEQENNAKKFPEPEILREDMKNICLGLMKLGCQITKTDFTVESTIKMFSEFIEPPLQTSIIDGFDFAIDNGLIVDNILSKIGQLVVKSRLDVVDGLSLLYAWNINESIFKKVFTIICIQSFLSHGINDYFHKNANKKKIKQVIQKLINNCLGSEHVLIYKLYKYAMSNRQTNIFDMKLINNITKLYDNQINGIERAFNYFKIILDNIHTVTNKKSSHFIICSFNFGLKSSRAFKSEGKFKYNNSICDLSRSLFKFNNYSSIVFYSNLFINGKLNVNIVSPWLLL
jgi:HrpA-like RNA helicase